MKEADSGMIKLTASNYSIWNTMMEDILYCKELFEPIKCRGYKSVITTDLLGILGSGLIRVSSIM